MKRLYTALLGFLAFLPAVFGQGAATSAVQISGITEWNNNSPTLISQCLVASPGTPGTCGGAATDVAWFKFTIPSTTKTASVKITVIPTGFDAIIDFYAGTAGAPIHKECINAGGSGATEILKTQANSPTNNPIVPGTEYYVRVSSVTDVASGCFQIGMQYYSAGFVRDGWWPNPSTDGGMPGYRVTDPGRRNIPNTQTIVEATRFRFVDSDTPNDAGCQVEVAGNFSQIAQLSSVPCICYGNTYNVYVQLRLDGGHWCGETEMRFINMEPYPSTVMTTPLNANGCVVVTLASVLNAEFVASTHEFQWEFATPGLPTQTYTSIVGNSSCPLAQVPCLKFNRIYTLRIRVKYCGVWGQWGTPYCVITVPIGYTQVINLCGGIVQPNSIYQCATVPGANSYAWQFAPVNPNAPAIPIGPALVGYTNAGANSIYFNANTLGLAANTTYRVQVKARNTTCSILQEGEWGPWCLVTTSGSGGFTGMILEDEPIGDPQVVDPMDYSFNERGTIGVFSYAGLSERILTLNLEELSGEGSGMVRIFSLSGQLVQEEAMYYSPDQTIVQTTLPAGLPDGIYIAVAMTPDGTWTDRFYLGTQ